ncbi:hypothetical protein HYW21_08940 [Candidatus Woesearchaeota archaeon]|nr:hypothetical protein [Candidatus Woesearchaeota archaeon]
MAIINNPHNFRNQLYKKQQICTKNKRLCHRGFTYSPVIFGMFVGLLFLLPLTYADTYQGHGEYRAWGNGTLLFYGDGTVMIAGKDLTLCLYHGTIKAMQGTWYEEQGCLTSRRGVIFLEADGLNFDVATTEAYLEGDAMARVDTEGNWFFQKKK